MDSSGTKHEPQISPARLLRRSHLLGDFLTVIAEGSIRQAADKIAISQSALTRRIQDLEEGLGANLFERTSRGMTLTPFGEVLKHHAQLVAITCQYAVSEISELLEGEVGELRISAGPAWAYALVPDAIAAMQATRPKIRVTLLDLINDVSLPMLASGLLGCAGCEPDPGIGRQLRCRHNGQLVQGVLFIGKHQMLDFQDGFIFELRVAGRG